MSEPTSPDLVQLVRQSSDAYNRRDLEAHFGDREEALKAAGVSG